jgi:mRNA interferase MazF
MRRGDIVIVVVPGDYGKPRPAVVVQADRFFDDFDSILVCPMSSDTTAHSVARVPVAPMLSTGLIANSNIMIDKLTVVAKVKVSRIIGRLDEATLERFDSSLLMFLDLR